MGLICDSADAGGLRAHLPLAACSALVLLSIHAILFWGPGLTLNINSISFPEPHGWLYAMSPTSADVQSSRPGDGQDILLKGTDGGMRRAFTRFLDPFSADPFGAVSESEPKGSPVTRAVSKVSLLAPAAGLSQNDGAPSAPSSSRPPLPPGHKGDLVEVEKLKALMAPLAKDNTVIVTPANAGFLDLALNLNCRLKALGATNTLFWALDKESADRFHKEGMKYYYDASLFSISHAVGYHDADYIRMMSERPRVWWRMLATGYDMLFLDADVVAFDSPEKYFERTADLAGQINGWGWKFEKQRTNSSHLCAGAFWVKSSELALEFMRKAFDTFAERKGKEARWDDQKALNWIIHDNSFSDVITANVPKGQTVRTGAQVVPGRFQVMFAKAEKILPGHLFWGAKIEGERYNVTFTTKMQDNDTETFSFRPSLFHMSGHGKKEDKVARMKYHGWWELDDNEKCKGGHMQRGNHSK